MPVPFLDVGLKNMSEHGTYRAGSWCDGLWMFATGVLALYTCRILGIFKLPKYINLDRLALIIFPLFYYCLRNFNFPEFKSLNIVIVWYTVLILTVTNLGKCAS